MDNTKWGTTHFYSNHTRAIVYIPKSNREYHIWLFKSHTLVDLKIENKILLSFKDTILNENSYDSFDREIKENKYIIVNGELKLKTIKRKNKFISKIKPSIYLS